MGIPLRLFAVWSTLFAALAYYAAIPVDAALDLKVHWAAPPLLVAGSLFASSLLPRKWFAPALALCLTALGSTTLLAVWRNGFSDASIIAGLLPYSDASSYFTDAQRILLDEPISAFSSRRPLFAALLSAAAAVTGNHLPTILWLLVVMVCLPLAYAVNVLRESWDGWLLPALWAALVWLFYRRFIGTVLTEHLGLALGLLGFAWLWRGAEERNRASTWCGLLALTLALNARAGAMLVLPALAIWSAAPRSPAGRRWDWKTFAFSLTAIAAGFGCTFLVLAAAGGDRAGVFSNFSYTLYGLVHGGNWTLALSEHPWLRDLADPERSARIYGLSMQRIADQPLSLLAGTVKSWLLLPFSWFSYISSPRVYLKSAALLWAPLTVLLPFGLYHCLRCWKDSPAMRMLGYALLGIVLSAPFAPPWDADGARIYAATIPLMAVPAVCGLAHFVAALRPSLLHRSQGSPRAAAGQIIVCAVLAAAFAVSLPAARGSRAPERPARQFAACDVQEKPRALSLLPGTTVQLSPAAAPRRSLTVETAEQGPVRALGAFVRRTASARAARDDLAFWQHYRFTPAPVKGLLSLLPQNGRLALLLDHSGGAPEVRLAAMEPEVMPAFGLLADDVCFARNGNLLSLRLEQPAGRN